PALVLPEGFHHDRGGAPLHAARRRTVRTLMGSAPEVRRLAPDEAPALVALRREALENEPFAFSASVDDDRGLKLDGVRRSLTADDRAVFGYFSGPLDSRRLAGMVGVMRAPKLKQRHRAGIFGMYVSPAARRAGAGRALLDAAIAQARGWAGVEQVHL